MGAVHEWPPATRERRAATPSLATPPTPRPPWADRRHQGRAKCPDRTDRPRSVERGSTSSAGPDRILARLFDGIRSTVVWRSSPGSVAASSHRPGVMWSTIARRPTTCRRLGGRRPAHDHDGAVVSSSGGRPTGRRRARRSECGEAQSRRRICRAGVGWRRTRGDRARHRRVRTASESRPVALAHHADMPIMAASRCRGWCLS